jgi:hypothetical protein
MVVGCVEEFDRIVGRKPQMPNVSVVKKFSDLMIADNTDPIEASGRKARRPNGKSFPLRDRPDKRSAGNSAF